MSVLLSLATLCLVIAHVCAQCLPSDTTASGTLAPAQICSGQLLFEDNFDTLNQTKWKHEISLWGGGNNEFQWYVNDRFNSFVTDGNLHLKPTFTADVFGEDFLRNGHVVIHPDECTSGKLNKTCGVWKCFDFNTPSGEPNGCDRQGTADNIINPARSARVTTVNSFAFKFGIVEIRAKTPAGKITSNISTWSFDFHNNNAGDWIWPALVRFFVCCTYFNSPNCSQNSGWCLGIACLVAGQPLAKSILWSRERTDNCSRTTLILELNTLGRRCILDRGGTTMVTPLQVRVDDSSQASMKIFTFIDSSGLIAEWNSRLMESSIWQFRLEQVSGIEATSKNLDWIILGLNLHLWRLLIKSSTS